MDIFLELTDLIHDHLGIERKRINPDACFDKDFNLGKDEITEFFHLLENHYKISFSPVEKEEIKTVDDLNLILQDHLNEI